MAEQVILVRHGHSHGNKFLLGDKHYVQGFKSDIDERGRKQSEWSARYIGELVSERHVILPPTVIWTNIEVARQTSTAKIHQQILNDEFGLDFDIMHIPELAEKREPFELEDKSGHEIAMEPRLRALANAIRGQHLNAHFQPRDGVEKAPGFQTWPEKMTEMKPFVRRLNASRDNPLIISSAGTLGVIRALMEYGDDLENRLSPQELFDKYLFKFHNVEGMAYQRPDGQWHMFEHWTRPGYL